MRLGTLFPVGILFTVSFLLSIAVIPVYTIALFSLFRRRLPSILSRLTVGIAVSVVGIVSILLIDGIGHRIKGVDQCVFTTEVRTTISYNTTSDHLSQTLGLPSAVLVLPNVLNSIGPPMVMITVLEFISAQSPQSMKGLFVGVFYAIRGLFLMLGTTLAVPFVLHYRNTNANGKVFSCGTGYFLLISVIATAGFVLYGVAVRRYKYRQRQDEPYSQIYAVNYYSHPGDKQDGSSGCSDAPSCKL